jgi:nucleoside-diphosphate-sugar epimerase
MDKSGVTVITGGAGYIGRHVRSELLAAGRGVISLDRVKSQSSLSAQSYECDITKAQQLQDILASSPGPIESIVHLASTLRTASLKDPYRATEVNILGTLNVLEAARNFGAGRLVFASSVSIYGSKKSQDDISEAEPTTPEDVYGAAKQYLEVLGEAYGRKYGIQFEALRIPIVVGPGPIGASSSPWRTDIFDALRENNRREILIPFAEDETLSIVHVEDLAKAFSTLLNAPTISHSIYNAPCETWRLADLKNQLESLSPKLRIRFGDAAIAGFPRRLNCERFKREFNLLPSLAKRLQETVQFKGANT